MANPESFQSNNHNDNDNINNNNNNNRDRNNNNDESLPRRHNEVKTAAASATNFTNAAILLQNSSSVYSRKVEYLHSLVFQTLQRLDSDKEKQNANANTSNKKRHAADLDIMEFEAFDPDWNFLVFQEDTLPIDDVGNIIDLEPSQDALAGMGMDSEHVQNTRNTQTPLMHQYQNQTRLSLGATAAGGFGSISKLDMNATMHSVTRNKSSIQSHAGRQLIRSIMEGSQGRNAFLMMNNGGNSGGGEGQAVLRLMNGVCDVSESGALLLPGTGIACDNASAKVRVGADDDCLGNNDKQMLSQEKLDMDMDMDLDHEEHGVQFDQGYDDGIDNNDDHDNDGVGFELHSPLNGVDVQTIANIAHGKGVASNATAANMRESSPWDLLDPHDASESKARPLRTTITYRLPHGVHQPPSFNVNGTRTKKILRAKSKVQSTTDDEYSLEYTCLAVHEYRAALKLMESKHQHCAGQSMDTSMDSAGTNSDSKEKLIPLPIQPLVFGDEFLYVLKSQQKQRAAEKRRIKRLQRQQIQEIVSSQALDASERFDDMYDDNDDDNDNDGPAFDFAGGDYNDDDHDDDDGNDGNLNSTQDIFDQAFQQGGQNNNLECKTFEDLCRAHLKEFAKGAERLAVETHLSKRVSSWQNKLEVVLAEEEERPEFDIQLYSNRIITNVQDCLQKDKLCREKGLVSASITVK